MSGSTDEGRCPRCGKETTIYSDYKNRTDESEDCFYCGYTKYWELKEEILNTSDLVDKRVEWNFKKDEYEEYVEECKEKSLTFESYEEWTEKQILIERI